MKIGEVAQLSGISARMLRHYDRIGLVSPAQRSANGYRDYSADDIDRLFQVESLRSLGLGLREIGPLLGDSSFAPAALVERLLEQTRSRLIRDQRLLAKLEGVRGGAPDTWRDVLGLIGLLQDLGSADPMARYRAVLGGAADDLPTSALMDALTTERDPGVVATLQWALAAAPDALPLIDRALTSGDALTLRNVVGVLVKMDEPRSSARMLALLGDPDAEVRHRVSLELGRRGHQMATQALVEAIVRGRDDVLAAEALGAIVAANPAGEPELVQALARALADPTTGAAARRRLVESLGELPRPGTLNVLRALTGDPDPAVAATATYLVSRRPDSAQFG